MNESLRTQSLALPGILALLTVWIPLPASAESPPPFVPAEVMVKFTPASEAAKALSRATRSTPAKLELLMPTTRLLTEKTGIPVKAKQALSGGWLLLAVDVDGLATRAAAKLRKHGAVADVQVKAGESKGVGMPETRVLDMAFRPGSAEAKIIEDQRSGTADGRFSGLVDDLAKILGLPLLAKAAPAAHLIIEIDLRELTLRLSEQLRASVEIIESVDLNYITTIR